jgi:class 3 adenylate cyclase
MRPTGTVTLLFSDIDGSTRLLRSIGVQRYENALAQHRLLLRDAFVRHAGDSLLTPQNTVLALIDGLVRHRGGTAFTPGMEV